MAETQYVIFALGSQRYCMQLAKINGIEQSYVVVPVPSAAEHMKGLIHLRGDIAPVYNLRERLGIYEPSHAEECQLLMAETHGMLLGFEVDAVLGIQTVPETDIKQIPVVVRSDETDYLESVIRIPGADSAHSDIILCISVDHIMSEGDFENVRRSIQDSDTEDVSEKDMGEDMEAMPLEDEA